MLKTRILFSTSQGNILDEWVEFKDKLSKVIDSYSNNAIELLYPMPILIAK